MFKALLIKITTFLASIQSAISQFRQLPAYEIQETFFNEEARRHAVKIKLAGKGHGVTYFVDEIVADSSLMSGFAAQDILKITYLATADHYEIILEQENIKKAYELIRSKKIKGNKTIQLRNKLTNENMFIVLNEFGDSAIIDKLTSQDAYQLGYLAGQEQSWKDSARLKLISNTKALGMTNE